MALWGIFGTGGGIDRDVGDYDDTGLIAVSGYLSGYDFGWGRLEQWVYAI